MAQLKTQQVLVNGKKLIEKTGFAPASLLGYNYIEYIEAGPKTKVTLFPTTRYGLNRSMVFRNDGDVVKRFEINGLYSSIRVEELGENNQLTYIMVVLAIVFLIYWFFLRGKDTDWTYY